MSKKIDTGKKILSLLDKLTDKKVKESKKNTIDSERVAEALEEKLMDDPYYLEDMEPEEYQDLMDSLPPKLQARFNGDDFADDMYESQSFKVESLDPEEAAGSMELFQGGDEVRSYIQNLNAGQQRQFVDALSTEDRDFYKTILEDEIDFGPREPKNVGGSMLMPPERENYRFGRLATKIKNVGSDILEEANKHVNDLKNEATPDQKNIAPVTKSQRATRDTGRKAATATAVGATVLRIGEFVFDNINSEDIPKIVEAAKADGINVEVVDERINPSDYPVYEKGSDSAKEFRKLQKEAKQVGAAFFDYEGRSYNTMEKKNKGGMTKYAEGSLMVPPEMEEMPEDTYDNIPPEEMAEAQASQLPDDEMENKYLDFVMSEALDMEEQEYLMSVLETDARLNGIFDKVMDVAGEFSGEGEVDGPGTGVSDSIPARLSDGEFVFTRKATDQLGADQLQTMMDDAERAYDGGMMKSKMQKAFGGLTNDPMDTEKTYMDSMQNTEEEIKRQMIKANRTPSVYSNLG